MHVTARKDDVRPAPEARTLNEQLEPAELSRPPMSRRPPLAIVQFDQYNAPTLKTLAQRTAGANRPTPAALAAIYTEIAAALARVRGTYRSLLPPAQKAHVRSVPQATTDSATILRRAHLTGRRQLSKPGSTRSSRRRC